MKLRTIMRGMAGCAVLFAALRVRAQSGPAPSPGIVPGDKPAGPAWQELWVPTEDLATVFGRYPRAVPLDRDQLLTLLRDAHADRVPANDDNPPPVPALVRQAKFEAWLAAGPGGQTQVRVDAHLEVEALTDAWTDVPLGLQEIALGTAEIEDGQAPANRASAAGLRRPGGGQEGLASLEIQGRGVHRLHLGFVLPTRTEAEGTSVALPTVAGVGVFVLHMPPETRADSPGGCVIEPDAAGIVARVALRRPPDSPAISPTAIRDFTKSPDSKPRISPLVEPDRLSWRNPAPAAAVTGALLQSGRTDASVDESGVTIRQTILLRPALGRLPSEVHFALPDGASAVRVDGPSLKHWDLGADGLHFELSGNENGNRTATFAVVYQLKLAFDARGGTSLALPVLEAASAHRISGELSVRKGRGIMVQRIEPGAATAPAASGTFSRSEETAADFVAGFSLVDLPTTGNAAPLVALRLEARRTTTRFSVDADVRADFQLDGVHLARTLAFEVAEGELFAARVRLPAGETVRALHAVDHGKEPEWRQEGSEILLNWTAGLPEASKTRLVINTRAELAAPKPGAPADFVLAAAFVPDAERLTGYVALAGAPALRLVTTGGEERLERRDGHTTPVQGNVAWFYRDDFRLILRVERRSAETEARFTGYALPLSGAVEIHSQIDYHFLYSGVETVKIRVPRESADAFLFTGEHIAERRRDDDTWTIRFQGEQGGDYRLGIQATLPAPVDKTDAQRFHFHLPAITPQETAHWSGAWAVEANADTEIRFATTGATEGDALHAPPLADYQPRRRVIGVFDFLGGTTEVGIDLDGVRHAATGGASAIVDRLDLETDASTSGVTRHRATVRARAAGDGFFNFRLPAGATLWSLTLDGEPVKPVGGAGAAEEVRVELPGGRVPANASTVVVVYETPGKPWTGSGWQSVVAPRFDDGVPVLRSQWTLRVPEGFEYRFGDAPAGVDTVNPTAGDLLVPRMVRSVGHMAQWVYYYPWFGNASPRANLPRWMAARMENRFSVINSIQAPFESDLADNSSLSPAPMMQSTDSQAALESVSELAAQPSPTIAPSYNHPVAAVQKHLTEAEQFYQTGRYDLALKSYEQVLALDPSNNAARRGEERVELAKAKHGKSAGYPETRGRLIAQSANAWELPVRRNNARINDDSGTVAITRKLHGLIIPNIEFRQTTLNDAVEFLRQEARRVDTQSPEADRGINIFLKLSSSASSPPNASIPGLPPDSTPPQVPSAAAPTGSTRISLTLSRTPLYNALDYVAKAANLKLKVEPYAVSLVPMTEETGDMTTLEIRVPPNFITSSSTGGIGSSLNSTAISAANANDTANSTGTGNGAPITRMDTKAFFESSGVTFPPGSSAVYLASTNKLVIRNTQANIDLVATLVGESGGSPSSSQPSVLDGRESARSVSGLLPIRLDLPSNGVTYKFDEAGLPGKLEFHYSDWAVAARWRWIWLTLGAVGFLVGAAGWARPWRRTLYVGLALTFFPLIVAPSATVPCNALLAGWLWAVAGWCVTRFLLRRRRLAAALPLVGALLLTCSPTQAAPVPTPPTAPAPSPELVIVPYDATKPVASQDPGRYYLPYERFLLLWDAAKHHRRPAAPEPPPGGERYTLGAARYDARLVGDTVEIAGTLDFQKYGDGWVGVPLGFEANRVATVVLDGAPAALGADGVLWVGAAGGHRVSVFLRLPAPNLAAGTHLSWSVPPTVATLVTFMASRTDLRAELRGTTPDAGEIEEIVPEGRRLNASLGGTRAVNLTFHDAPAPAAVAGLPALASVDARLTASVRQESVEAEIRFSFPGGTQDHFTVSLDRDLTLTGLDAPDIRQWRLSIGGERQTLEIDLATPAHDGYRFTLTADRPLGPLPVLRQTFPQVSAGAVRTEQTAALLTDGAVELSLPDGLPASVRRVNAAAPGGSHLFAAFAGDGTALVYSVQGAADKRVAHINYLYQIGRGKIDLAASVRLSPALAGEPLAMADLRLPAGFTLQAVVGEAVQQWWLEGDVLSLRFRPGTGPAEVPLLIYLVRRFEKDPDRLDLEPLAAVGFASTDGEAVVAADRSWEVALTLPTGVRADELSETNAATAAREFEVKAPLQRQRAFRYHGTGFDVVATLQSQPARWQTQWVTHATARDGAVALETHVNASMLQGATDTLEFSLPPGLNEARIGGADVRDTVVSGNAGARRTYRVLFQNALYTGIEAKFTISLEFPLDANNQITLPDLTLNAEGGRTAGGFILVENASAGEMALDPHGLEPAVEKDVPFLPPVIVAGTRFFRAAPGTPWSLGVQVTALEKTAGRAALVAYAELTTTLRADGEEWHRATYRLQNRRLQFLPVELPVGVELIGAKVAGESVRVDAGPVEKDGAPQLLIPLVKTRPGELSYDVELIYRRPAPGPDSGRSERFFGRWQLQDPRLPGVPVEKTLWDVYVPPGARLLNVGGNLEPVVAALSTTEKLASALSDLRELSATYRSASASEAERRRAFDNYNSLATDLKQQATAKPLDREDSAEEIHGMAFKKPNVASQNAAVSQQRQQILSTVDSLSAANGTLDQNQPRLVIGSGTVTAGNQSSDGFINYGSPIRQPTAASGSIGNEGWYDNRINTTAGSPGEASSTPASTAATSNQLALNDSVTVNLPAKDADATASLRTLQQPKAESKKGAASEEQFEKRLSTARATTKREALPTPDATPPSEQAPTTFTANRDLPPPAGPEGDKARSDNGMLRPGHLQAEGRVSLSVDFPVEGQVYHFKKIESDARLTLWSVQPTRFVRLAWMTVLLVGLVVLRAVHRFRRSAR